MVADTLLCELDIGAISDCSKDKEYNHENNDKEILEAWDDQTGKELRPDLVQAARAEELKIVDEMGVYEEVPFSDAVKHTGRPPIKSRWLDINKGDSELPNYRSRWVAKQIKTYEQWDLFAATPTLEAARLIISTAASRKGNVLMSNDVRRAYFYAEARRKIYVELPPERQKLVGPKTPKHARYC